MMNRFKLIVLAASVLSFSLAVAGCGEKGTEESKMDEKPATSEAPATPIDPATAATINGKIVFSGEKPTPKSIKMDAEPMCKEGHTGPAVSEDIVVNDNGTLANVIIYVKSGLENRTFETPKEPVTLDQHGCQYLPHVIGVQVGQEIKILNSDKLNHNIHPLPSANREWNQSMAPGQEPLMKSFPREEIAIPVKCNVHPWMKSYIGVMKHPFFAVSGKDGAFEIKGLPPGEYEIEAWHEKLGAMSSKITLAAKDAKGVDFTFKADSGATSKQEPHIPAARAKAVPSVALPIR